MMLPKGPVTPPGPLNKPKKPLQTVTSHGPGSGAPPTARRLPKPMTPPGPPLMPPNPVGGGMVSSHGPGSGAPPTAPIDPMQRENERALAHYQRRIASLGNVAADDPRLLEFQRGAAGYQRKLNKRPSMTALQQAASITR